VVEAEFALGRLERVLNRPALAFDRDQGLNAGALRTPGREVSERAVSEIAPDQQATGPGAAKTRVEPVRREVGQLQIRLVVEPRPLAALARGQAPPGRGVEPMGDRLGSGAVASCVEIGWAASPAR
jgi:hypothetical protein